jgi:serine/threonine protein kinase
MRLSVTDPKKELLADLLLQWEELRLRGQDTPATELAKDYPELIDELARRIKALKTVSWLDRPLDDDPPGDFPSGSPPHSPRTLAGRYRLDELIAEGGFAQVYRAYDSELQRTVAIKIPKPSKLESNDAFQAEARRVARLKHDNIVPVYDVGLQGETCFIVTEYVELGSLADRLVKDKPTAQEALRWISEVADALEYAHLNGVIHLDIKPANILIDANGRAKIADFGIARSAMKTGEFAPSLGTLRYMSPEQLEGKPSDHRSDLYSLGVVLHEVLTGCIPYSSSEPNVLRKEIVQGRAEASSKKLSPALQAICKKALSKSPHQRHSSAAQFAAELRRVVGGRGNMPWLWTALLLLIPTLLTVVALSSRPPVASDTLAKPRPDNRPPNLASDFRYEIVGDGLKITGFIGSSTIVKIPSKIEDKPVTIIGQEAFKQSKDFTEIILPSTTKTIEDSAFRDCHWLRQLAIPDGVTTIRDGAFTGCALTQIFLPASVTQFGNAIYACPSLEKISVDPANRIYTSIDGLLFDKQATSLLRCPEGRSTPVVLPSTITHLGRMAFHHCLNLSSVDLPDSITSIGAMAFYRCTSLKRIVIPRGVRKIEAQTFVDCPRLESISLSEGLEEIGDGVFWGCTSLSVIRIPASVTTIHEKAFENCPAKIEFVKQPP